MTKVEVTYDGKKYNDIADAFTQALIDGTKESIMQSLEPFMDEINSHNGIVIIDIPNDFKNSSITFNNIPEELLIKITNALD